MINEEYEEVIDEDEFDLGWDLNYADTFHELDVLGMIEKEK